MQKLVVFLIAVVLFRGEARSQAPMKLSEILSAIAVNHPSVKMYDAEIRSSDEAAAMGAAKFGKRRSWEPGCG